MSDTIFSQDEALALAKRYKKARQFDLAEPLLTLLAQQRPQDPEIWCHLGLTHYNLKRMDQALKALQTAEELDPRMPSLQYNLGIVLSDLGRYKEACEAYEEAINQKPTDVHALFNLASTYKKMSQYEKAYALFQQLDKMGAVDAWLIRNRAMCKQYESVEDKDVLEAQVYYKKPNLSSEEKIHILFALGKMFEDCGDYATSYQYYTQANNLHFDQFPYDNEAFSAYISRVIKTFTPDLFRDWSLQGLDTEAPVFIVGMSRSGKSLLESCLIRHPDIVGIGECNALDDIVMELHHTLETKWYYPMCVEHFTQTSLEATAKKYLEATQLRATKIGRYYVNTIPNNFVHCGLIRLLFPRATIIHCQRQANDLLAANYVKYFSQEHHYTYNAESLSQFYRDYTRLMNHWREVLPGQWLDISYEELVENPDHLMKRIGKDLDLQSSVDLSNVQMDKSGIGYGRRFEKL